MSVFFKAGRRVAKIIGRWDEQHSPARLEKAIGCEAMCVFHYKDGEVYLEMPNGSKPHGCEPVEEGQFMPMMFDD